MKEQLNGNARAQFPGETNGFVAGDGCHRHGVSAPRRNIKFEFASSGINQIVGDDTQMTARRSAAPLGGFGDEGIGSGGRVCTSRVKLRV